MLIIRNEYKNYLMAYNGLGQLVREWQSHAGAVNPVTTPSVQYAYTEALGGNHSRPVSMTYPGGDEVVFGYGSGVDDATSRLMTLTECGGVLRGCDIWAWDGGDADLLRNWAIANYKIIINAKNDFK